MEWKWKPTSTYEKDEIYTDFFRIYRRSYLNVILESINDCPYDNQQFFDDAALVHMDIEQFYACTTMITESHLTPLFSVLRPLVPTKFVRLSDSSHKFRNSRNFTVLSPHNSSLLITYINIDVTIPITWTEPMFAIHTPVEKTPIAIYVVLRNGYHDIRTWGVIRVSIMIRCFDGWAGTLPTTFSRNTGSQTKLSVQ